MKRLTQKDENGYYLTGDGIYSDWGVPEKFRGEDIDNFAAIEDILGDDYELDRLRELVEADRKGRCVVLPCKIDGAVYTIDRSLGGYDYVTETKFWWSDVPEVGETIFLTRAEAVAALKAREQDG